MVAVATILVVDDEPRIVQLVRDYLEHGGFTVLTASDGPAALRTARTGRPDLVVLDLGLPGLDGLDVARSLRREGEVPIIMLTARTEESDRIVGLELGADDYLTKPFSPKELVARVRAVLAFRLRPPAVHSLDRLLLSDRARGGALHRSSRRGLVPRRGRLSPAPRVAVFSCDRADCRGGVRWRATDGPADEQPDRSG